MSRRRESGGGKMGIIESGVGIASAVVGRKLGEAEEGVKKRAGELRREVVASAYEAKRGMLRTLVEFVFLSTGLLSLICGVLLFFKEKGVPLYTVLVAYGMVVSLYTLFRMKTTP